MKSILSREVSPVYLPIALQASPGELIRPCILALVRLEQVVAGLALRRAVLQPTAVLRYILHHQIVYVLRIHVACKMLLTDSSRAFLLFMLPCILLAHFQSVQLDCFLAQLHLRLFDIVWGHSALFFACGYGCCAAPTRLIIALEIALHARLGKWYSADLSI